MAKNKYKKKVAKGQALITAYYKRAKIPPTLYFKKKIQAKITDYFDPECVLLRSVWKSLPEELVRHVFSFLEVMPSIEEMSRRYDRVGTLVDPYDGGASHCEYCRVGIKCPNQLGSFCRLVAGRCDKCEELYCHECNPVFSVNDEHDSFCHSCIFEERSVQAKIFAADLPRFAWVSERLG